MFNDVMQVCGAVGRAELLCAFFFILSFSSYQKAKHENSTGRAIHSYTAVHMFDLSHLHHTVWLFGSWLLAVISMLCKEQGITVIAVSVAFDFLHNYQVQTNKRNTNTSFSCGSVLFLGEQAVTGEIAGHSGVRSDKDVSLAGRDGQTGGYGGNSYCTGGGRETVSRGTQ